MSNKFELLAASNAYAIIGLPQKSRIFFFGIRFAFGFLCHKGKNKLPSISQDFSFPLIFIAKVGVGRYGQVNIYAQDKRTVVPSFFQTLKILGKKKVQSI